MVLVLLAISFAVAGGFPVLAVGFSAILLTMMFVDAATAPDNPTEDQS